jgi:Na+-transporting methylmalonyl-CoA/oxaloacetate decarboxylase gamma subunit
MITMTGIGVVLLVVALIALAAMAQSNGSHDR